MSSAKVLLNSKTIWGLMILILNMFMKENQINDEISAELYAALTAVADSIGALLVLWGRITAKGPLFRLR